MKLVNESERLGPWVVDASGEVYRLGHGARLSLATTRALVMANSPAEARNQADAESFRIGVKNAIGDEPAEICIYGEVGDPWEMCDAASMSQFLRNNKGKAVNVRINSPGGLAYDGIVSHNALLAHDGPVSTTIEGFAGSAASIIAVAGKPAKIYENAQFYPHRASVLAYGNRAMMKEAMDWLDQIDDAIARTYKAKTGKALDKIKDIMVGAVDGTLFSARDAVANRFCDEVILLTRNAAQNQAPVTAVADQSPRFVAAARALRMRTHSELFVPANSVVSIPKPVVKPKNDMGEDECCIEVGDRVIVVGIPRVEGQTAGMVRQVVPGPAYGIQFDGSDQITQWSVASEIALEDPLKEDKEEMAAAASGEKPVNCNCEYPATKYRNGSGHNNSCPCHKEWEDRGGFKQRP